MMISLGTFTCSTGHPFEAPLLGDSQYGEFLLWSANGAVAYLNSFKDSTFDEVEREVLSIAPALSKNPLKAADVVQRIFGRVVCDPDSSGQPFEIGAKPRCPLCAASVVSWEPTYPAKVAELDIPAVTHTEWDQLMPAEKTLALTQAIG